MRLKIVIPFLSVLLVGIQTVLSQVLIKEGPKDGIEVIAKDPNRGAGEIFTSMFDLENFFKKEKEYIEDIRWQHHYFMATVPKSETVFNCKSLYFALKLSSFFVHST